VIGPPGAGRTPGQPAGGWASDALLPGAHAAISEAEWFRFLELAEPLHQWGSAFLFDEARARVPEGLVRVYLRDDSGAARHVCVRLDASRSAAARAGVLRIEAAARHAADVITAGQRQASQSVADLQAEEAASRAFTEAAEALYRELLRD
jgi:hypothetical protein